MGDSLVSVEVVQYSRGITSVHRGITPLLSQKFLEDSGPKSGVAFQAKFQNIYHISNNLHIFMANKIPFKVFIERKSFMIRKIQK